MSRTSVVYILTKFNKVYTSILSIELILKYANKLTEIPEKKKTKEKQHITFINLKILLIDTFLYLRFKFV